MQAQECILMEKSLSCADCWVLVRQNAVLYAGDAADRALIQQHELRYACDPKSSKRAKFNVLLVLWPAAGSLRQLCGP